MALFPRCMVKVWISVPLVGIVPGACADVSVPAKEPPSVTNGSADPLARLSQSYGIEIITTDPPFPVTTLHGMITGKAAGQGALDWYTPLFFQEFSLYPPTLVRRARLNRVVLCEDLSFAGQRRNAIPDFAHDTLYLDTTRGAYSPEYLRTVIHHEFFHIIDYRDDGLVYSDHSWSTLNASAMKYGDGGRNAQHRPEESLLVTTYPGFLDYYGTTGVEEDKAELFAHLIVRSSAVAARSRSDSVLMAKVWRLKRLMGEFCPEMNDGFWKRAASLDRRSDNTMVLNRPLDPSIE